MASSKQTPAKRSPIDPLSQGLQLDPIHRDSITYPLQPRRSSLAHSPALLRTGGPGKKVARQKPLSSSQINLQSLPPLREAMPINDGEGSPHFNGWMTIWGKEGSRKDMDTCCMGFWFPPALYGKTHWRLQQVSAGKSPDDHEWNFSQGCNGACWTMSALSGMGGILIGAQRSQIRGTYGIDGSITQDACLGLFLPWCTQIQNDREVRAREGAQELRNSKRYKDFEKSNGIVDQQPRLVPPMNLPGGLNHLGKGRQVGNPSGEKTNMAGPLNSTNNQQLPRKTRSDRAQSKLGSKQENGTKGSRPQLPGGYDGVDSIVVATYIQGDNPTQPVMHEPKRPLTRRGGQSGNELNQLHRSPDSHGRKSFQFPLPDCDSIVATSRGVIVRHSPKNEKKDLSYVHDFTGSPIDKDILEHYEREERASHERSRSYTKENSKGMPKEHASNECTRIVSGTSVSEHNPDKDNLAGSVQAKSRPQEHNLGDCNPVAPEEADSASHTLADCPFGVSTSGTTSPQHALVECIPMLSTPGTSTPQHHLVDCTPIIANPGRTTPLHTLEDCSGPLSAEGVISQHSRNDRGSNTSSNEASVAQTTAPISGTGQHSLESCELVRFPREPMLSQHTLDNCEPTTAYPRYLSSREDYHGEDSSAQSPKGMTASHHTLDENSPITDPEGAKTHLQHTLEDDETVPARAVEENEHTLAKCSLRTSLHSIDAEENVLADCSASANLDSQGTNEHTLGYCSPRPISERGSIERRSSSLGVTSSENSSKKQISRTREHRLASCPAVPSRRSVTPEDEGNEVNLQVTDPYGSGQNDEPVQATVKDVSWTAAASDLKRSSSTENDQKNTEIDQNKKQSNRKITRLESIEYDNKKQRRDQKSRKVNEAVGKTTDTNKQNKEPEPRSADSKSDKRRISPNPSETSATPSMAQQSLANILAHTGGRWKKNTQLDGAIDLDPEPVESQSIAIHVAHEFYG